MNKVEVYKAMLQAEQTKAEINQSLVARYKAEIDGAWRPWRSTRPACRPPRRW
jgi:hypothetical protein